MAESKTVAITTGAIGSVIAAALISWMGIGATTTHSVTIDGPSLTTVDTPIRLAGHLHGDVRAAYWTDELGQTQEMNGSDGTLDWYCLGPGQFTVSLIMTAEDGSQYQARHEVRCV